MKIKITLFLIFACFPLSILACDCSPVTLRNSFVQKSYEKSDIVFLGIVDSVNAQTITFSIVEILKGQYIKSTLITTNQDSGSCSIVAEEDEMWLIYIEKEEDGNKFLTNMCLPNRNYGNISLFELVPAPFGEEENLYNSFKKHKEILLLNELNGLRQRKILNDVKNLKDSYLFIQYGLSIIGILILFLILSFYLKIKQ